MFCHNCGNKLEKIDIVCPKCGVLVSRREYKEIKKKNNCGVQGLISLIFGFICLLMCFNFMLKDISTVGMYTNISERIYYALDLVLSPLLLSFISIIISSVGKNRNKTLNKIGLFLSIISIFFVITEIVIVIIY